MSSSLLNALRAARTSWSAGWRYSEHAQVLRFQASRHFCGSALQRQVLDVGKFKGLTFAECSAEQPEYCARLLTRADNVGDKYRDFLHYLRENATAGRADAVASVGPSGFGDAATAATGIGELVMNYGKYKSLTFEQVSVLDPQYCQWTLKKQQEDSSKPPSAFVRWLLERPLGPAVEQAPAAPHSAPGGKRRGAWGPREASTSHQSEAPRPPLGSGDWQITFGKHKGRTFHEVLSTDRQYCEWMVNAVLKEVKHTQDTLAFVVYVQHQFLQAVRERGS